MYCADCEGNSDDADNDDNDDGHHHCHHPQVADAEGSTAPSNEGSTSQTSACMVELNLSAVSLPSAIANSPGHDRQRPPKHQQRHEEQIYAKPNHEVRVTGVYTIRRQDRAPPAHFSTPKRPPHRPTMGCFKRNSRSYTTAGSSKRGYSARVKCRRGLQQQPPFPKNILLGAAETCPGGSASSWRWAAHCIQSTPTERNANTNVASGTRPLSSVAALGGVARTRLSCSISSCRAKTADSTVRPRNTAVLGSNQHGHHQVSCRRTTHTAPTRKEIRPRIGKEDGCRAVAKQLEALSEWLTPEEPRSPTKKRGVSSKPRARSAPARGQAIARAIDGCRKGLAVVPGVSRGPRRLLQQWDRSSRVQRATLLRSWAEQLAIYPAKRDDVCQRKPELLANRVESTGERSTCRSNPYVGARDEPDSADSAPRARSPLAAVESYPVDQEHGGSFLSIQHGRADIPFLPPGDYCNCLDSANSNSPELMRLLGPYSSLLAMRIASHLRILYSGGHAVGPCLRVATLLAEAALKSIVGYNCRDCGGDVISKSVASSLLQQLSAVEVIQTSLQIVAAAGEQRRHHQSSESNNNINTRIPKNAGRPNTSTTKTAFASTAVAEEDCTDALRLLVAIVRANAHINLSIDCANNAESLKERLTRSGLASSTSSSGIGMNAIGCVMSILWTSGKCISESRAAGGQLLVELGRDNPQGVKRVWNAVLCLLGLECGLQNEEAVYNDQIIGCQIAMALLNQKNSDRMRKGESSLVADPFNDRDKTIAASLSKNLVNGRMCQRMDADAGATYDQPRPKTHKPQPEVIIVPSVLNLALSNHPDVRKAARELAALLARIPGPCCYLLAAGMSGFLGSISGVNRGAPLTWLVHRPEKNCVNLSEKRKQKNTRKRKQCRASTEKESKGLGSVDDGSISTDVGYGNESDPQSPQEEMAGILNGSCTSDLKRCTCHDSTVQAAEDRSRDGETTHGLTFSIATTTKTSLLNNSGGEIEANPPKHSWGSSVSFDGEAAAAAEWAIALIRDIILTRATSRKEQDHVGLALFSALAPLAILDVVVSIALSTNDGNENLLSLEDRGVGEDGVHPTFETQVHRTSGTNLESLVGDDIRAQEQSDRFSEQQEEMGSSGKGEGKANKRSRGKRMKNATQAKFNYGMGMDCCGSAIDNRGHDCGVFHNPRCRPNTALLQMFDMAAEALISMYHHHLRKDLHVSRGAVDHLKQTETTFSEFAEEGRQHRWRCGPGAPEVVKGPITSTKSSGSDDIINGEGAGRSSKVSYNQRSHDHPLDKNRRRQEKEETRAHIMSSLKDLVDAALYDCPGMSWCVREADTVSLSMILFRGCTAGGLGSYSNFVCDEEKEMKMLQQNLALLTNSVGRVKPPPSLWTKSAISSGYLFNSEEARDYDDGAAMRTTLTEGAQGEDFNETIFLDDRGGNGGLNDCTDSICLRNETLTTSSIEGSLITQATRFSLLYRGTTPTNTECEMLTLFEVSMSGCMDHEC